VLPAQARASIALVRFYLTDVRLRLRDAACKKHLNLTDPRSLFNDVEEPDLTPKASRQTDDYSLLTRCSEDAAA
jgi:hypothetical protein